MERKRFSAMEKRIFAGCFFSYLLAYAARMNLAAALPRISEELRLTDAQGGLIQTVFAVVYAAGQMINGALADRVSPRRHVVLGLALSAACNLLFGLCGAYWQMLALWSLNGAAQSMLWTPMVRLIAVWFDAEKRGKVSFWMCLSFIFGNLAAWALSGMLSLRLGWRAAFFAPAGILLLTAAFARLTLRDREQAASGGREAPAMDLRRLFFGTGLGLFLLSCLATGYARDGVLTWAPTLIGRLFSPDQAAGGVLPSLLIPLINLLGLLLGQALLKKSRGRLNATICRMLTAAALCAALLAAARSMPPLAFVAVLGTMCSLMYCVSSMQNVMLPMEYAHTGHVSLIAGIGDCMIYIGASLSSVASGAVMQSLGESAVYLFWGAAALASWAMMTLGGAMDRAAGKNVK